MIYEILLLSVSVVWNCEDGILRNRFQTVDSGGLWDCQRLCNERPECNQIGFIDNQPGRICAITAGGGMIEATSLRMTICTKDVPVVIPVIKPEMKPIDPKPVEHVEVKEHIVDPKPMEHVEVKEHVVDPKPMKHVEVKEHIVDPKPMEHVEVKEHIVDPKPVEHVEVKEHIVDPKPMEHVEKDHHKPEKPVTEAVIEKPRIPPPKVPENVVLTPQPIMEYEEVSIPIETSGVDIIKWCSSDPECRTFGDSNSVCQDAKCTCSHGFEAKSGFGICQASRESLNPMHAMPTLITISFNYVDTKKLASDHRAVQKLLYDVMKNIFPEVPITTSASAVVGSTVAQFAYEMHLRVVDYVKIRSVAMRVSQSVTSTRFGRTLGTHVTKSVSGIVKVSHLGVQTSDCFAKGATKTFLATAEDESVDPNCVALECQSGMFVFYDPMANASRCAQEFETRHRQEGLCLYNSECASPKICVSGMCMIPGMKPSEGELPIDEVFHTRAVTLITFSMFIVGSIFLYRRFIRKNSRRTSSPRWKQDLLGGN